MFAAEILSFFIIFLLDFKIGYNTIQEKLQYHTHCEILSARSASRPRLIAVGRARSARDGDRVAAWSTMSGVWGGVSASPTMRGRAFPPAPLAQLALRASF